MKVLIVNSHGLGDVVLTLPVVESLIHRGDEVRFLLKSSNEMTLIKAFYPGRFTDSDFLFVSTREARNLSSFIRLVKALRRWNVDAVVPVYSLEPKRYSILAWLTGARIRVGIGGFFRFLNSSNFRERAHEHKAEYNLRLLDRILAENGKASPLIDARWPAYDCDPDAIASATAKLGLTVAQLNKAFAVSPGSGPTEQHKRWPIQYFAEFVNRMTENGERLLVLGGPGEEGLGEYLLQNCSNPQLLTSAIGTLTIEELVAVCSKIRGIVANCNGLSHICAAAGTGVIGLYGPTDYALTGAWGDKSHPIKTTVDCSPCYRRGFTQGCGNPICMTSITPNIVYDKASQVFELG